MSDEVTLVGPVAHPAMLAVLGLEGTPMRLAGRLLGGDSAGQGRGTWPAWVAGEGDLEAVRVAPNAALTRYAEVMGLNRVAHPDGPLLGVEAAPATEDDWDRDSWQAGLAAEIARQILGLPDGRTADRIAARLPAIGVWASSRLRAAAGPVSGGDVVAPRVAGDLRLIARREPFAGFFAVEEWDLSHRTHEGGFTPVVTREGFVAGDAVVLLPWDPRRDRVLVIEQFRLAPAMRADPQPWLLEPVAGRVDCGEGVEAAARREAREEAGLEIGRLIPAIHHYPSPGAVGEFLYLYVGIADLPDGVEGIHGLEGETEDIRGHLLDRTRLTRMALAGQITNGPLAMIALWLDREADRLLEELAGS